jgi:hypothetical protein
VQQGTRQLSVFFQPTAAVEGVDALPTHFPGCTDIKISLEARQQVFVLSALPVLARWVADSTVQQTLHHAAALASAAQWYRPVDLQSVVTRPDLHASVSNVHLSYQAGTLLQLLPVVCSLIERYLALAQVQC